MKPRLITIGSLAAFLALGALAQTGGSSGSGSGPGAGTSGNASGTTPANPAGPTPLQPWSPVPGNPAGDPPGRTFSVPTTSNSFGLGPGSNSVGGMGSNMIGLGSNRFPNRLGTNNLFLPTSRTNSRERILQQNTVPAVPMPQPNR